MISDRTAGAVSIPSDLRKLMHAAANLPAGLRHLSGALLLLAVSAGGCASGDSMVGGEEVPATLSSVLEGAADAWPAIRQKRIRELLPEAMSRAGVDAWLVVVRENDNDPLAAHVGGENAGGTAGFLFFREGAEGEEQRVRAVAVSPGGEAVALRDREGAVHDSVIVLESGASVWERVADEIRHATPRTIAVNSSDLAAADGLSYTERRRLEEALGPEWSRRLVPSQELVVEWLSVKTPEEIEIMRHAADLTARLQLEAYATVVPGVTKDSDLTRFLKGRMAELGVADAWAPEQNPSVQSGLDRGHSHATDRVIRPGDFIQTDFGIRVGGMWVTDIQRFAYVLAPGETEPPEDAREKWEKARRGAQIAFDAMRPGVRGYDVDVAQRAWMREVGSLPLRWGTGHPVGYWAHDVGPALTGAQTDAPPSGNAVRLLRPGQTFSFDGFFSWPLVDEGIEGTKTISVEEMVVITEEGAEFLTPPQEELILIRSSAESLEEVLHNTFSIAAVDRGTGEVGVAVTTRRTCVGNGVPWVRVGVGAVATQAFTRVEYGAELLDLLEAGRSPRAALEERTRADEGRERRQVGVVSIDGRSAQFTGSEANPWAGDRAGPDYVTQGNLLVGPEVLDAVGEAFEASAGSGRHLVDRLIDALEAGQAAGGDARRGMLQSAAVIVADPRDGHSRRPDGVSAHLNVCEHAEPVGELRRQHDAVAEILGYRTLEQPVGNDVLQLAIILHALGYFQPEASEPEPQWSRFTPELVASVDAFRGDAGLSTPSIGTPPGFVDPETVRALWEALERQGFTESVRQQIREITAIRR